MNFIDAYVIAVPTAKKAAYLEKATTIAALFKENGALSVVENWGEDVPDGKLTSFPLAVKKADDETVVMSWVEWPSKAVRDAAWPAIMQHPSMQPDGSEPLFDGKRMIFGGFQQILRA